MFLSKSRTSITLACVSACVPFTLKFSDKLLATGNRSHLSVDCFSDLDVSILSDSSVDRASGWGASTDSTSDIGVSVAGQLSPDCDVPSNVVFTDSRSEMS